MKTNPDDYAYPPQKNGEFIIIGGLSKREYFAACALQGLCSSGFPIDKDMVSNDAIYIADKLIEELNK